MQTIGTDDFADVISGLVAEFTDETCQEIEKHMVYGAALAEQKLHADTSRNEANKNPHVRSGEYAKSWTTDKTGGFAQGGSAQKYRLGAGGSLVVYNKKHYRLTHLLEKGAIRAKTGIMKGDGHISRTWEEVKQYLQSKGLY